jgi:hypothetical protein
VTCIEAKANSEYSFDDKTMHEIMLIIVLIVIVTIAAALENVLMFHLRISLYVFATNCRRYENCLTVANRIFDIMPVGNNTNILFLISRCN